MRHIDRDRVPHLKNEVEIAIHHKDGFKPLTVRIPTEVRLTEISCSAKMLVILGFNLERREPDRAAL